MDESTTLGYPYNKPLRHRNHKTKESTPTGNLNNGFRKNEIEGSKRRSSKKHGFTRRRFSARIVFLTVCLLIGIILVSIRKRNIKRELEETYRRRKDALRKQSELKRMEEIKMQNKHRSDLVMWYKNNPKAPLGLSCDPKSVMKANIERSETTIPPPIFQPRLSKIIDKPRVQVALVIPFVEFQISKLSFVFKNNWNQYPPCGKNTEKQDVDLFFYTENELSDAMKHTILELYHGLGQDKVGCFNNEQPYFLSLNEKDSARSHLEGAAYSFFSLFRLLENDYKSFMLAEPDVAPVQPDFLRAIVKKSKLLGCEQDKLWQIGSPPLVHNVDAGDLLKRVDLHMNGNAMYVLGCPGFEDYKCRVQTFYTPKDECSLVAGCSTHQAYEGGYDHALYQFRVQKENFEYARFVASKFQYSVFMQNRGEDNYDVAEVVKSSPSTYFIHSKSVFTTFEATTIREVALQFKYDTCDTSQAGIYNDLKLCYRNLRTAEFSEDDAIRYLCNNPNMPNKDICVLSKYKAELPWKQRMPGKTYLWTMDFHGGPTNCDLPIIREAGGAIHAEIDGVCHFYGLCRDRLKVIRANNWHEYDPTEEQKESFKVAYKDDPEFKRVDAFICHHPVANCELFLPFNRPIIIHASTRLEFGRHDGGIDWRIGSGYDPEIGKQKWAEWIKTLQNLSLDERNIIAANSVYDQEYIKYFTGIKNVELLPSWCGDGIGRGYCDEFWDLTFNQEWLPTRSEIMIVPYRSNLDRSRFATNLREPHDHPILKDMRSVPKSITGDTSVKLISELYENANPTNMLHHPAIIIIPYQISTINLIELYRLNIPTFCPSLHLLKQWCIEYDLMWETHYGWPERILNDSPHFHFANIPDPNNSYELDKTSLEWEASYDHWMPFADFYQNNKGVIYFDSWEDFFIKYNEAKSEGSLKRMNQDMKEVNLKLRDQLVKRWKEIFARIHTNKAQ